VEKNSSGEGFVDLGACATMVASGFVQSSLAETPAQILHTNMHEGKVTGSGWEHGFRAASRITVRVEDDTIGGNWLTCPGLLPLLYNPSSHAHFFARRTFWDLTTNRYTERWRRIDGPGGECLT